MNNDQKTKEEYLVFISHSNQDKWIAQKIAEDIERKGKRYGATTFIYERDISGGERIPEKIRKKIQSCSEFVLLLSRYSIESNWVVAELGAAWGLEKRIITIMDKVSPNEIHDIISLENAIDLNDFDKYLKELISRIRGAGK